MQTFRKPERNPDFEDCFSGKNAFPEKTPLELAELALANSPLWFRIMFSIRQKLATLVGLQTKTDAGENPGITFLLSLPELQNNDQTFETGLKDKHLDFAIRISKNAESVEFATQVWFNNLWGRLYLFVVMPFHKLILSQWIRTLGEAK